MSSSSGLNTFPRPLCAKFENDFAYPTLRDRVPAIIAKIADTLCLLRDEVKGKYGQPGLEELKHITGEMSRLRYELQTNKPMTDIVESLQDAAVWNTYLELDRKEQGGESRYFFSPWLLTECYCYRRINEAIQLSSLLIDTDPFQQQKREAFTSSLPAIECLIEFMKTITSGSFQKTFNTLFKVSLWGNRCDLSISGGNANHQHSDALTGLADLEPLILADHSEQIWLALHRKHLPVAIVMDNAGFEAFADLCLADFLVQSGVATRVDLHIKAMPWFVSDVTRSDFEWQIEQLSGQTIGKRWKSYLDKGQWVVHADSFWTLPHPYHHMPQVAPKLHSSLAQCSVVIFKGDLNFRKLTSDLTWPVETSFDVALQGFNPTVVCVLRTLKSDSVVGLKPGQDTELYAEDKDWLINGKRAVILCSTY